MARHLKIWFYGFLVEIPPPYGPAPKNIVLWFFGRKTTTYGPAPKNIVLWFSGRKKSRCNSDSYSGTKYPKRGSNPHGCNSQGILSPSCLPFHHSGRRCKGKHFFAPAKNFNRILPHSAATACSAGPSSTMAPVSGSRRSCAGAFLSLKSAGSIPNVTPSWARLTSARPTSRPS